MREGFEQNISPTDIVEAGTGGLQDSIEFDASRESREAARTIIRDRVRAAFESGDAKDLLGDEAEMRYPMVLTSDMGVLSKYPDIFFEELISLTKSERDSEPEKLRKMLGDVVEGFFSSSDTLAGLLGTADQIVLASRISRIEELRGNIGQAIHPGVVYDLAFGNCGKEDIVEKINTLGPGERIDVVHQLETIFASANAQGYDRADHAAGTIKDVIAYFRQAESPFMRIVADVAAKNVEEEEADPTASFIVYSGDKKDGRMNSQHPVRSLSDKCMSNLPLGYKMIAPSRDVVIGMDHAGMPRYAVETDAAELREMPDIGTRAMQAFEDIKDKKFSEIILRRLVNSIGTAREQLMPGATVVQLYAYLLDKEESHVEALIESGSNIVPHINESWGVFRQRLVDLAEAAVARMEKEGKVTKLHFESFDAALDSEHISPFATLSEDDRLLLAECMRPEIYERLQGEIGMPLRDISFRSLVHLLRFLSKDSGESLSALRDYVGANPDTAQKMLEAFFIASEDIEYGTLVLEVCANRSPEESDQILSKYTELASASAAISSGVLALESDKAEKVDKGAIVRDTEKSLLQRARLLMQEFATSDRSGDASVSELSLKLSAITADNALFGSMIRALRGTGTKLEEIRGAHIESLHGGELDDAQMREMLAAFNLNRLHSDDPKILIEASLKGFHEALQDPAAEFKVLSFGQSPIAFLRCEKIDEETMYIGSLNISPELKGESVAGSFLKSVLREKNKDYELQGEVWEKRPLAFYKRAGFEEDGVVENWHGTGERFNRVKIPKGKLIASSAKFA